LVGLLPFVVRRLRLVTVGLFVYGYCPIVCWFVRWLIVDVDCTVAGWLGLYVTFVVVTVRLLLRCCSTTVVVVVDCYCWLFVVPYLLVLDTLDVGYL
jgi:hypothetical protein